ncbi:pyridoxal phosphate-dependent aminotransferase [Spirochaeta lutea]|uniref:Aminotransferase class I/classII large domain-containing protein n=1 Tax=Spirochaeta lutea TaxID=1480694 RepID=A0A098QV64_9SPIO|nr:pyridoxal phosphate-dependent aminotransferase [Spirochaeta lutea]KGE71624.1 hypothetical protein DC28_10150 [Spirochaeta lutea]
MNGKNPLHQLLDQLTAQGTHIINLVDSNFHDNGLVPDPDLLAREAASYFTHRRYNPDPRGSIEARRAIARFYAREGITLHPDRILITASSSESYTLLFTQLADPGDRLLLPLPGYPLFEELASFAGLEPDYYPLEPDRGFRPNLSVLESLIQPTTRFILLISPNNPTGAVLGRRDLEDILELGKEYGIMIIFDEVFSSFLYGDSNACDPPSPGEPLPDPTLPSLPRPLSLDTPVPSFTINGISKLCASPDLKLSWLVVHTGGTAPAEPPQPPGTPTPKPTQGYPEDTPLRQDDFLPLDQILQRLETANDVYLNCSSLSQALLPGLLAQVHQDGGITHRIVRLLQQNRETLLTTPGIDSLLPHQPQGGIHCILAVPACQGDDEGLALDILSTLGILVHPGYLYGIDDYPALVITLLKDPAVFKPAIESLVSYLRTLGDANK